jgi:hypothetical protein
VAVGRVNALRTSKSWWNGADMYVTPATVNHKVTSRTSLPSILRLSKNNCTDADAAVSRSRNCVDAIVSSTIS